MIDTTVRKYVTVTGRLAFLKHLPNSLQAISAFSRLSETPQREGLLMKIDPT